MHDTSSGADQSARQKRTASESDYTRLFDLSLDLLAIAGLDGYFKAVNPAWTHVMGWSEEELLARPVADFMHPEDRERTLQARSGLAMGTPVRGLENRYLCKDGSYRWLAWQSSVGPGETTVFAVARDITERRQREQEKLVLSKLESTGILAGGIAHDFNNLLSRLLLNVEMAGVSGETTPEQKRYLGEAERTIQTAKQLVQQLTTFAHGGEAARRIVDLKDLLIQSLELALEGSALGQEVMLVPNLWPVEIDETQIAQALRNLVLNAREAMTAGGTARLAAENVALGRNSGVKLSPGKYVRVTISDTGTGIAPEVLPKIFDPYFSTKQMGTQKGMGLGLTVTHAVMKKHGGAITVEPREGGGTVVTCYLPAAVRN